MIYEVIFSANKKHSDIIGYKQGFQAIDESGFVCAFLNSPGDIIILKKKVKSKTGIGAILKFQKWQCNGKPQEWLLEDRA